MAKDKLAALTEKRNQLNAQIQALKAKEQAQERKNETRKKIIIGGMVMKMVKDGDMPQERMQTLLDKYVESAKDRELFGLEPKSTEK